MKNQEKPFFIARTKAAAIFTAKQGLKLNDKTLRLKNVRITQTNIFIKGEVIPSVKIVADTGMQTDASMIVGYSKKYCNIPSPPKKGASEFAKRAGIVGKKTADSGIKKLLEKKPQITINGITINGVYITNYGSEICIVKATGLGRWLGTFSGLCIFDNSEFKQSGQHCDNWDMTVFTLIPNLF